MYLLTVLFIQKKHPFNCSMVPSNSEQVSSGCWLYQLSDQYLKEVLIGKLRKSSIDKQIDISNSPQILANIDWSKFESLWGGDSKRISQKGEHLRQKSPQGSAPWFWKVLRKWLYCEVILKSQQGEALRQKRVSSSNVERERERERV